jgi:monoamine oxidase
MTQVYLAHKSNFWEADGYTPSLFTDGIAGMVAGARNGEDPEEVTSFTSWTLGPNASLLDALPPEEAGRRVIEAIEKVRPAATGQLEFLGIQSWGTDPFAQGGWAYFRPGQITRFAAAMGAPHGQIRFCGEHLGQVSRGMEGAMESGERVASEILEM